MRRLLPFALLLSMAAAILPASEPARARKTQIRIPVWTAGEEKIKPANFKATLNGEPARILGVKTPGDDQIILLVLDVSAELADFEPAREAIAGELAKLPASTYVGLLRAQDGLAVLHDPTPDRAKITDTLAAMAVTGNAGFLNTVEEIGRIADSMSAASPVRVSVLYVTDSNVRNYREDFSNPVINSSDSHDLSRKFPEVLIQEKMSKLETSLAREQTPLFVVHLRYRDDRLNEAYLNGLKRLAETTAGTSAFCRSTAEIPGAIEHAFRTIAAQYSVTVALPEKISPVLQIQITSDAGDNSALTYRTRFVMKGR